MGTRQLQQILGGVLYTVRRVSGKYACLWSEMADQAWYHLRIFVGCWWTLQHCLRHWWKSGKSIGPSTLPTPDRTSAQDEPFPFNTTLCFLPVSHCLIQFQALPLTPWARTCSFSSSLSLGTLSNAFVKSRNTTSNSECTIFGFYGLEQDLVKPKVGQKEKNNIFHVSLNDLLEGLEGFPGAWKSSMEVC